MASPEVVAVAGGAVGGGLAVAPAANQYLLHRLDRAEAGDVPAELVERCQRLVERPVTAVAGDGRPLARVAWCTGGAQSFFEPAIAAGADVYLTGEISEPQAHLARETGVAFIAVGHHASERYGAQALGAHLAATFAIEHVHIEIDNPG